MEAVLNNAGIKANEITSTNDVEKAKRIEDFLNTGYEWVVKGIPNIFDPIGETAEEMSSKYGSVEEAAKAMMRNHIAMSATTGFLTSCGGIVTLPVTVSADILSVTMIQMRMVAGLARIGGYDLNDDRVRTFVLTCLTGQTVSSMLKDTGINVGEKVAIAGIKKIPAETIRMINQKVGFRMLTKFGESGVINLGKAVPVVGGLVGAGFDAGTTKVIADIAYKTFIK